MLSKHLANHLLNAHRALCGLKETLGSLDQLSSAELDEFLPANLTARGSDGLDKISSTERR